MRDLDLTSLRLFVAVCETRNIARAGENANIVGSAISKRLAQLESAVGAKLLTRRKHGMEPTPAGETLLEHARAIMTSTARIERDMSAYSHGLRGQIRVLATSSVLAESLAEDVAMFLQDPRHRSIRVDMEEGLSHQVIRGIKEGVASLGICWDASPLDGLQSRPYRNDHLAMVVHPAHPLARESTLQFSQTLDYEHVGMPVASSVQVMLHRAAAQAGKPLLHRVIVSNFDSALRVVRANLGITIVPREVAQPYAHATGLIVIPLTDAWAERRFTLCFRDEENLSPAAQVLLEHLANVARHGNTAAALKP
ncbi:MAG TPA: LysR family transcriptional regulator [Achromobacter sp.]|uniref:LysR family transcriptional regulator n=1 Tax=unclassified Achromobacter TaxID=2626865 RepID=UPI000CFBE989|nr:LysR family transcriptional regulator [Achromobacter sp. MYb9]PQZ70379.1 LysR family transcriptional regulator [Achromobacter sp. MYb9]